LRTFEISSSSESITSRIRFGLDSIHRHSEALKNLALTAIVWTSNLKGPLHLAGLSEALLVNSDASTTGKKKSLETQVIEYDQRHIPNLNEVILGLCQGVLKKDPATSTVGFRHEDIQHEIPKWLEENHLAVSRLPKLDEVILAYLCSDDFSGGPRGTVTELEALLKKYRFLSYAAQNWTLHARCAKSDRFNELLLRFLSSTKNLALALQVEQRERISQSPENTQSYIDDPDQFYLSPLRAAASHGFSDAVKKLLTGTRKLAREDLRSALCIAAENGDLKIIKLLLENHAPIDDQGEEGRSALDNALDKDQRLAFLELMQAYCHEFYVQHIKPSKDTKPSQLVKLSQHITPPKIFGGSQTRLEKFSDFFFRCKGYSSGAKFYCNASNYKEAIVDGRSEILMILLARLGPKKLDLVSKDVLPIPLLHLAIGQLKKHTMFSTATQSTAEYMLDSGSSPDITDAKKNTALFYAVGTAQDTAAVELLIEYGANVDKKCAGGRTVLFEAVKQKNLAMVKLLLSNGASIQAKDDRDRTILHEAAAYPDEEIMSELVFRFLRFQDFTAWFSMKDLTQKTPAQTPAEYGSFDETTKKPERVFRDFIESPQVAVFFSSKTRVTMKELQQFQERK
jgi:ankyrin repeat protein